MDYTRTDWEKKADPAQLELMDRVYAGLSDCLEGCSLHYTGSYIGLMKNGKPKNFIYFHPRQNGLWLHAAGPEQTEKYLREMGLQTAFRAHKHPTQMKICLKSQEDFEKYQNVLRKITREAQQFFDTQDGRHGREEG